MRRNQCGVHPGGPIFLCLSADGAAAAGSLGDGGMNVTGTLAQPRLPAIRLAVHAKRVTGGVGPIVVTQLRGSIPPGTYGAVIRAGHFTRAAVPEASRPDRNAIKLVDGPELAGLALVPCRWGELDQAAQQHNGSATVHMADQQPEQPAAGLALIFGRLR